MVVFAAIAALSVLCIIFMLMYACCCKIQCFRFCLHFFWFLLGLLTVIFFLLGVVFGVVALIGEDGVDVFNFLLSQENLSRTEPYVFKDKQAGQYLNVCLNGNKILKYLNLS